MNQSLALRPEAPSASWAFSFVVTGVLLASAIYALRTRGLFACQARGYGPDRYLSYCQAVKYGDYDHGAIWFGLEPAANHAAATADVLFLGNSRLQFGFSSETTDRWFSALPARYYLLGFSHFENVTFEAPLLRRLTPRARAYVFNLDRYFEDRETAPGGVVMHDPGAEGRYRQKQMFQRVHRTICSALPAMCADQHTIFRARPTGSWLVAGGTFTPEPVSYDAGVDTARVAAYRQVGSRFLDSLPVDRSCVIFTFVPTVKTDSRTAQAIADALGVSYVAPEIEGLVTFDGSHLDHPSAERWSAAFLDQAGPVIRRCLEGSGSGGSGP